MLQMKLLITTNTFGVKAKLIIIMLLLSFNLILQGQDSLSYKNGSIEYGFGKQQFDKLIAFERQFPDLDTIVNYSYLSDSITYLKNAKKWVDLYGNERQKFLVEFILYKKYFYDNINTDAKTNLTLKLMLNTQATPREHLRIMDMLLLSYTRQMLLAEYLSLLKDRQAYVEKHNLKGVSFMTDFSALGNVYYINKNYEHARINYKKARDDAKRKNNNFQAASFTNNIGLVFFEEYQYDSSLHYFKKALTLFNENDYYLPEYANYFRLVIKANIARVKTKQGLLGQDFPVILEEIRLSKKFNELGVTVSGYLDLATNYYLMKDFNNAFIYIDSIVFMKQYKINAYKEALELKGKIYLLNGNIKAGNYFFILKKHIEDSLVQKMKVQAIENASMLYQVNRKEKQLIDQKNELIKNQLIIQNQKKEGQFLRWLLVLSLVLVGVVIIFLLYVRKKSIKINTQKIELTESLQQQENLLKEVHHRVKNNLQVVSGLLVLQSNQTDNQEVKKIMEQGQSRIESMALLHQMLYNNTDYKTVDMKEYFHNLLANLNNTFGQGLKIGLEENVIGIHVEIDKAISLGLIITELITNSFKHAFAGKEGCIAISLTELSANNYKLIVEDNGKGLPPSFDVNKPTSLGLNLISILANELRASIDFSSENGTKCTLLVNLA